MGRVRDWEDGEGQGGFVLESPTTASPGYLEKRLGNLMRDDCTG